MGGFFKAGRLPGGNIGKKQEEMVKKWVFYQLLKSQFSTIRKVILAFESAIDAQKLGDYHGRT